MKKKFLASAMLFMIGTGPLIAGANTYTYTPNDGHGNTDVYDLDHNDIYFWAIQYQSIPLNETIRSAKLTFKNIVTAHPLIKKCLNAKKA